jgi:hypothetical protein
MPTSELNRPITANASVANRRLEKDTVKGQINRREAKVDIRSLKKLLAKSFPKENVLYDLVLGENDMLDVPEFLAKVDCWLKLLRRV